MRRIPFQDHVDDEIFTISNKSPTKREVDKLKELIEKCAFERSRDRPLLWFRLLQSLKEKAVGKNSSWLTLEDAKAKPIKDVHIDDTTIEAALLYFHGVGEVVYFSEIPDMIVIEPPWLFQELTKVITIESHHAQKFEKVSKEHRDNFEKESLLHEDVLKCVCTEDTFEPLVAIMKKYALLLPVPADYKLREHSNIIPDGKVYLVPSLLPAKGPDKTNQAANKQKGTPPPVTLSLHEHFIPVGLTSRLLTKLCKKRKWTVLGQIYKDSATFEFKKRGMILHISVLETSKGIEVSCDECAEDSDQLYCKSLQTIHDALRKLSPYQDISVFISCDCGELVKTAWPRKNLDTVYTCYKGHISYPSSYTVWFDINKNEKHSDVSYQNS